MIICMQLEAEAKTKTNICRNIFKKSQKRWKGKNISRSYHSWMKHIRRTVSGYQRASFWADSQQLGGRQPTGDGLLNVALK